MDERSSSNTFCASNTIVLLIWEVAGSRIPEDFIRFAVDSNYDTVLFVTYDAGQVTGRILEDDILTIYGTVVGDYSYETVMGATITLPWIHGDIIDTSEVNMN